MKTWYFLPEFIGALENQLKSDDERHGNTWLERPLEGQEGRIYWRIVDYYHNYVINDIPMPWLKVAGLAFIAWIRENHPELWEKKA